MLGHLSRIQPTSSWTGAHEIIGKTEQRAISFPIVNQSWDSNHLGRLGVHMVNGYNTLQLAANQRLIEAIQGDLASPILDIYGVEYIIALSELENTGAATLVDHTNDIWVYRRPQSLDVARLVYEYEVIASSSAVSRVVNNDFEPANTVVLDATPNCDVGPSGSGAVQIVSHHPQEWVMITHSNAPAILVLSETAYPGWQATIDGTPATIMTAYSAIRAICVPAGEHKIIWHFRPQIFLGGAISGASLLLVLIAIIALRHQLTDVSLAHDIVHPQ